MRLTSIPRVGLGRCALPLLKVQLVVTQKHQCSGAARVGKRRKESSGREVLWNNERKEPHLAGAMAASTVKHDVSSMFHGKAVFTCSTCTAVLVRTKDQVHEMQTDLQALQDEVISKSFSGREGRG